MSALTESSKKSLIEVWNDLITLRLDWAFRAHQHFVDSLSEETRMHLTLSDVRDEAYVVVFGKTQVGKTTLLLDLMGVAPQALSRVSKVLRGGRPTGRSATATTMEYRRSSDSSWHLDIGSGLMRIDDDETIELKLAEIRNKMTSRKLEVNRPVILEIPSNLFRSIGEEASLVRMLDLPGDNPSDKAEQDHVKSMAEKYVRYADLILLVGRGDDLSFLLPDALNLPGISDWQIVPNRFRIVTTYSFTPETVREMARNNLGQLTPDFFRQRLLEQIETFGLELSLESKKLNRFFPLEFGASWQKAMEDPDALTKALDPIITDLKQQLHNDIKKSTTKFARLRNALDIHVVAEKVKRKLLSDLSEKIKLLENDNNHRKKDINTINQLLKNSLDEKEKLTKILVKMPQEEINLHIKKAEFKLSDKSQEKPKENCESFNVRMKDVSDEIIRKFILFEPSSVATQKEFWRYGKVQQSEFKKEAQDIIDEEFSDLRKHLNGYIISTYFPKLSESYNEDCKKLRKSIESAANSIGLFAAEIWINQANKNYKAIKKDIKSATARIEKLDSSLQEIEIEIKSTEKNILNLKQEKSKIKEKLEADANKGKTFLNLLDAEYLNELRKRKQMRAASTNQVSLFLQILADLDLVEQRKKLLNECHA